MGRLGDPRVTDSGKCRFIMIGSLLLRLQMTIGYGIVRASRDGRCGIANPLRHHPVFADRGTSTIGENRRM